MNKQINYELAKVDGDYLVDVTIGDTVKAVGKKLVTAKGEFEITEIILGQQTIVISTGEKTAKYNLLTIAQQILDGKMSIK